MPPSLITLIFRTPLRSRSDTFIVMTDDATKAAIEKSLCEALRFPGGVDGVKSDASALLAAAAGKDEAGLLALDELKALSPFKYTYISGAGLVALMLDAKIDPKVAVDKWSDELDLNCKGALGRDYEYFETSITKVEQMKEMLVVMKNASDKRQASDKASKEAREKETKEQAEAIAAESKRVDEVKAKAEDEAASSA